MPPPPPGASEPGGPGGSWGASPPRSRGFFANLFDLSFEHFVTTSVIKILYVLAMIGAGLYALFIIVFGFQIGAGAGILALLIGAPLAFFLIVIYARVFLELIMIIFRIGSEVTYLADRARSEDR